MPKLKSTAKNSNLLGMSLLELKLLLETKQISASEIFDYFLKRIKKYNQKLNGYLTVCHSDKNLPKGLPIAIKDAYCTKGIRTTAASKVLDDFIPPYESTVTQKLLLNNFSFLGKTNLDAWCHGSSTETSDYGTSHNPWDLKRSPGGSSGGSAAVVAAYLAPAAIGTETAGSIRQPAAWTGIVGLKPTYGRVSRYGVIAMGSSLDSPGPLTRTVEDAAYLLGIIAGADKYDATSVSQPTPDYLKLLNTKKRFRLGIPDEYFEGIDDQVKEKVNQAIKILEKMGHSLKKIKLIHPKYAISDYTIIQRSEVSSNLSRYDGIRYGNPRSFFGTEAKKRVMLGTYSLSYGYYDAYYKKAQKVRTLIINDFKKVFKDVDIILAPTTPITALKIGDSAKYPFFGELMDVLLEPSSMAGLCAISLPVGLDKANLPIGLQLMGAWFNEQTVLDLAYQFEKETEFFGITQKILKNYDD
jgi:aspartyl-tRNA(Asn)/glutamyl-tRNA(Gln) amidotransferase subunit A